MKNTEKVEAEVKDFIRELAKAQADRLGINLGEALNGTTSLIDSGLFDSFSFMALLADLEKKFSVEIDFSSFEPDYFTKIDGLATIIAGLISNVSQPIGNSAMVSHQNGQWSFIEMNPSQPYWKQLPKLFDEMYSYFAQHGFKPSLRKEASDIWVRSLEAGIGNTIQIIGCVEKDRLIGFVQCSLKLLPGFFKESKVGIIDHIYVHREYRRQGISKELLFRAENWLRSKKVSWIELLVVSGNQAGIEFWNKMGFETELYQMKKHFDVA